MNILITGSNGYLGSFIVDYLDNNFPNLNLFLSTRNPINTNKTKKNFIDINWNSDLSISNACNNIDIIIHTASINSDNCNINYFNAIKFNGFNTHKLVNFAIENRVKKIIYLSTYHVYSDDLNENIDENTLIKSTKPYSISKRVGEISLEYAIRDKLIGGYILRISNGFGKPINNNSGCWNLFLNQICRQAIVENKIEIKSKHNLTRNFIPILQISEIISKFIFLNNNDNIIYNIGAKKSYSLIEIGKIIKNRCEILYNKKIEIITEVKANENIYNKYFEFNIDKLLSLHDFDDNYLEKSIDNLLEHCKINFLSE